MQCCKIITYSTVNMCKVTHSGNSDKNYIYTLIKKKKKKEKKWEYKKIIA